MSAGFRIKIVNDRETQAALEKRKKQMLAVLYEEGDRTRLTLTAAIKSGFNKPGRPRRQTGGLSRGVRGYIDKFPWGVRIFVGILALVPYARILEEGGMQPGRIIMPRRKKVLRWTTGVTHLGEVATLGFGLTRKQAFNWRNTLANKGDVRFAKRVRQKGRRQRPLTYIRPEFLPGVVTFKNRIVTRLGGAIRGQGG